MEEQARQGAEYERKLEAQGVEAYVATGAEGRRRPHDFRPESGKEPQEPKANWLRAMAKKLDGDEGRAKYKLRRRTVEPVFGIVKSVPGFRRFSLRGMEKVRGEWNLVTLADNCKRLHKLQLNHAVWRVRSDRIRPARDWTTAPEAPMSLT